MVVTDRLRRMTVALVAASLVGAFALPADAKRPRADQAHSEQQRDCQENTPETVSYPGVTDSGATVSLDVAVLLDGVTLERGREIMAKAAQSYAPLNVTLNPVLIESVVFAAEGFTIDSSGTSVPAGDANALIRESKRRFKYVRPKGIDVVFTITAKELFDWTDQNGNGRPDESERDYAVTGLADCIGGVRFPERAFAVGEDFRDENLSSGPLTLYVNASAKIASHEIGHLLGAQHHYANCVQGVATETAEREPSPCTVMFEMLEATSINFGAVDGAVVRGHALRYALP